VLEAADFAHLHVVVTTVDFLPDYGEAALRRIQRIGLPGKAGSRHLNFRLHLAPGPTPYEPEVLGGVVILHRLSSRFPHDLEGHSCGSGNRIKHRPARLIDYGDVLHLQRERVPVRADRQAMLWNRNDPVES